MAELPDDRRRRAVALAYEPGLHAAPQVIATGEGKLADVILALAQKHGVEIVQDGALAKALVKLEPGQEIPAELYRAVAEVIAFVYRMKGTEHGNSGKRP